MELEIGMYVRTKNGKIWPIISQYAISGHRKDIVKSSYNILDLLEVGDIVIDGFYGEFITPFEDEEILEHYKSLWKNEKEHHIKEIITHEQIKQISYKVGD